jgi:hypothetical protein
LPAPRGRVDAQRLAEVLNGFFAMALPRQRDAQVVVDGRQIHPDPGDRNAELGDGLVEAPHLLQRISQVVVGCRAVGRNATACRRYRSASSNRPAAMSACPRLRSVSADAGSTFNAASY